MSKHGNGVSSSTHTQQQRDHYANQHNPNNSVIKQTIIITLIN